MAQNINTKHQKKMIKKVPHKNNYDIANKLSTVLKYILILSTAISVLNLIFNRLLPNTSSEMFIWSDKILAFLAVSYFLIDLVKSHTFHRAEFARKNDFIDNSLKTNLSEKNSEGYYTNEEISKGIIKLGVNCFENVFFTKTISQKMLKRQYFYFGIVVFFILSIIIFFDNPIIIEVLMLALPYSISLETYKLYKLQRNTNSVFSNFKNIFSSAKKSKREFLIIDNTINYEKSLSESGILLDSKIFNNLNENLSEEWTNIKVKYKIS